MKITIPDKYGVDIPDEMIGLFFEDINYAADGGLYGEMIENRSFEFLKASGSYNDYYVEYDGGYSWEKLATTENTTIRYVTGSPLSLENPHYMRVQTGSAGEGFFNKGYDGICLKKDMIYKGTFFARCVSFQGEFVITLEKNGKVYGETTVHSGAGEIGTYNRFYRYQYEILGEEAVVGAKFCLRLSKPGTVEFDYISLFPGDAEMGIFRKDLFDKLAALKPRFIRFPGGCVVEGNTLANRYQYKDSLKEPWNRKSNWNRWAVHDNSDKNNYESVYSHYNQTLGLGYYEYFLLCERIGANPLPVLNVGMACQYQSEEMIELDQEEFNGYIEEALDLIEFANGETDTIWGSVRAKMGHPEPFHMNMMGIGNEQWETPKSGFFQRYCKFEKAIHQVAPQIRLIGSAGPDITSEKYENAWKFYRDNKSIKNFVYAVDEHYYVKPEWLLENVNFYDHYPREIKVFAGEYAAHPYNGMNCPEANNLWGALSEAAFLIGIEKNADVVALASYAPLFAKIGYTQWSPDMIWFNQQTSYGSPSYYVQKMFATNMGHKTILSNESDVLYHEDIFYTLSHDSNTDNLIIKIVNVGNNNIHISFELHKYWGEKNKIKATILSGEPEESNSIEQPERVVPTDFEGVLKNGIEIPAYAFGVVRIY